MVERQSKVYIYFNSIEKGTRYGVVLPLCTIVWVSDRSQKRAGASGAIAVVEVLARGFVIGIPR